MNKLPSKVSHSCAELSTHFEGMLEGRSIAPGIYNLNTG
jgi:hypothetical protein